LLMNISACSRVAKLTLSDGANMTLDQAIKHCEEKAECNDGKCSKEHAQLAEWLKELKYYRKQKQKAMNQWAIPKEAMDEMLAAPKFDEAKFRTAAGLDFYVKYSGINPEGKRYHGCKYCNSEKEALTEMDKFMDDKQNDMVSAHKGEHVIKSFTRGY